MNEIIDLNPFPISRDLSDEDKRRIAQICGRDSYREGQVIFDEGQQDDYLYLIAFGGSKLFKHLVPGDEEDWSFLQVGAVDGYI